MNKLSVVILTKNEEKNILDCLESIKNVDEIVVVDDNSEDRTIELIRNFSKDISIYSKNLDGDFSAQRNFGLDKTKNNWIMFLDADERLSEKLGEEINSQITKNSFDGFYIKRTDVIWGKRLQYGETGNIKLLRLAKKSFGKWSGKVHEAWDIKGKIGTLESELIHYPHQTVSEFLHEINAYSSIRAQFLYEKGVKPSLVDIVLYPKAKFFLNYVLMLGFLDGVEGLIFTIMMSFHSFLVRAKLFLLQKEEARR